MDHVWMTTFLSVNGKKFLRSLLPKKFSVSALSYEEAEPLQLICGFSFPAPPLGSLQSFTPRLPFAYHTLLETACKMIEVVMPEEGLDAKLDGY